MKKMIILAASLIIVVGTAVSCGKSGGSSSESDISSSIDTSSNEASSGEYTFEEAKKRAGESVRKKAAEALESTTAPPTQNKEEAKCDPEAEKAVRDFIEVMYTAESTEEILRCLYPKSIYNGIVGKVVADDLRQSTAYNFNQSISEDDELVDFSIESCKMLNEEPWLDMLEQYFVSTARNCGIEHDVPVMVTASCLADASYTIASAGTEEEVNISVVAVQIAGEGWKIIPHSSQQLASML